MQNEMWVKRSLIETECHYLVGWWWVMRKLIAAPQFLMEKNYFLCLTYIHTYIHTYRLLWLWMNGNSKKWLTTKQINNGLRRNFFFRERNWIPGGLREIFFMREVKTNPGWVPHNPGDMTGMLQCFSLIEHRLLMQSLCRLLCISQTFVVYG